MAEVCRRGWPIWGRDPQMAYVQWGRLLLAMFPFNICVKWGWPRWSGVNWGMYKMDGRAWRPGLSIYWRSKWSVRVGFGSWHPMIRRYRR